MECKDRKYLFGLGSEVKDYTETLKILCGTGHGIGSGHSTSDESSGSLSHGMAGDIRKLHGLIHARYVRTTEGLKRLKKRYEQGVYGGCLNVECNRQCLIPVGEYKRRLATLEPAVRHGP